MSDELDPLLLRTFAKSQRPLADAEFVARVAARMRPHPGPSGIVPTLWRALAVALHGLATGVAAPLRLRYAGLVALAGALVTVLSLLPAV